MLNLLSETVKLEFALQTDTIFTSGHFVVRGENFLRPLFKSRKSFHRKQLPQDAPQPTSNSYRVEGGKRLTKGAARKTFFAIAIILSTFKKAPHELLFHLILISSRNEDLFLSFFILFLYGFFEN